jgi:hypothetical protein
MLGLWQPKVTEGEIHTRIYPMASGFEYHHERMEALTMTMMTMMMMVD